MINYIEQMMKAAGVKPRFYMEVNVGDLDCNFQEVSEKTVKKLWENWGFHLQCSDYWMEDEEAESIPENFEDFKKSDFWEKKYPPFTSTKQLELIKLLFKEIPTSLNPYFEPVKNTDKWQYIHTDLTFEEALAEMVWNALTVLDKTEVKKILEE